jgi:hypothetical protein
VGIAIFYIFRGIESHGWLEIRKMPVFRTSQASFSASFSLFSRAASTILRRNQPAARSHFSSYAAAEGQFEDRQNPLRQCCASIDRSTRTSQLIQEVYDEMPDVARLFFGPGFDRDSGFGR